MTHPTTTQITEARQLLCDPDRFGTRPGACGIAWAILKQARGQTYNFKNLPEVNHHKGPPVTLSDRLREGTANRLARIHARAAEHGIGHGLTPNGGDAA